MDQTPNILINPEGVITAGVKKRFNLKYVFILLGVIVVIEIIFGVKVFLQKKSSSIIPANLSISENQIGEDAGSKVINAKLSLETTKKEFKIGEIIPVTVSIDTDNQIVDGVDVVLKFDPELLEANSSSITKGILFPDYPVARIDPEGVVRISAITSLAGDGYLGSGVFATINFKAKFAGKALVKVDFTKDSTIDTNIVSTQFSEDMLGEVKDLEVVIK